MNTTLKNKLETLNTAMEVKTRNNGESFASFTRKAPSELKNLFLEHYNILDISYQIFRDACAAIYGKRESDDIKDSIRMLLEDDNEFASIYDNERLGYLGIQTEEDIFVVIDDCSCASISEACAIWYNRQVEEAISIITREYLKLKI